MRPALAGALALGLATACTERPQEPASHLRVPRPEGWTSGPAPAGALQVGPTGRPVLLLEKDDRPVPPPAALAAAVEAEGVEVLEKESFDDYTGVRYSISARGAKQAAFVGARRAGAVTVWCSTVAGARPAEVEQAAAVCRGVSWEG